MKIFAYGAGAFALALGSVLNNNGHDVTFFCRDSKRCAELNSTHVDNKYFNGLKLDEKLNFVDSIDGISNYNILILGIPSKSLKETIEELNKHLLNKKVLIISATKGLEPSTNSTVLEFLRKTLNPKIDYELTAILGPGFAKNIIKKDLTCVNAVSKNLKAAIYVQNLFSNEYFRVYAMDDEIGAEYSSSIKNAIAIGSGILYGIGYKENARSALITRGLTELVRFGTYFGAKKDTFFGLTGIGDLMLTCSSKESRNFSLGEEIGKSNDAISVIKNNKKTVEGLNAIKVINALAQINNIDMPIVNSLYKILYEGVKPSTIAKDIMTRPLRVEVI